jgi:hypothetical protein
MQGELLLDRLDAGVKAQGQDGFDLEAVLRANKPVIDELAGLCRKTELYKRAEKQGFSDFDGMTARQVYEQMLNKMANAPTYYHARASLVVLVPIISDRLAK